MRILKWIKLGICSSIIGFTSFSQAADQDVTRITYYANPIAQVEISITGYTYLGGYGVDEAYLIPMMGMEDQKILATARKGGVINIRYHKNQERIGFNADIEKVEVFYQGDKDQKAGSVEATIRYGRNHTFQYADVFFDVPSTFEKDIRYWIKVTSRKGEIFEEPEQALLLLPESCEFKLGFEAPVNEIWQAPGTSEFLQKGQTLCVDYDQDRLYALGLQDVWYRVGMIPPSAQGWLEFKDIKGKLVAKYEFPASLEWQFMIPKQAQKVEAYFLGREYFGKFAWDSNFGKNFVFPVQ